MTSERIVCDIGRWTAAIDAIIKAEGAKVPELDNRRGRRATRVRAGWRICTNDDATSPPTSKHEGRPPWLAALCTRNGTSTREHLLARVLGACRALRGRQSRFSGRYTSLRNVSDLTKTLQ